MREIRVGISGWRYSPWRGIFYPPDLAQRRELEFASRQLNSIEINGSFYSLQRPESYRRWYQDTPDDFIFSVKGNRYITHIKRLKELESPLANFFASGLLILKEKLGPILWQFPPSFKFERERFEKFFSLLPKNVGDAVQLAKKFKDKKAGRILKAELNLKQKLRYAVEIRNDSFKIREFIELLRKFNIAFVFADSAGKWPYMEDLTSDFVYMRLHGAEQIYTSGYDDRSLDWWAKRILLWKEGKEPKDKKRISSKAKPVKRDVFVYFDNDVKVRAPFDALRLLRKLKA